MRADDQPRPHDQRSFAEDVLDDGLARRLQRAVGRVDVLGLTVPLLEGRILARPGRQVGVRGDARDEAVVPDGIDEQLGGRAHDSGDVTGCVDDGVEAPALERGEIVLTVAVDMLGVRKELGVRATAVEERQLVAALECCLDDGAPDELRAAQDQQLHAATPSRSSSSSFASTAAADTSGV